MTSKPSSGDLERCCAGGWWLYAGGKADGKRPPTMVPKDAYLKHGAATRDRLKKSIFHLNLLRIMAVVRETGIKEIH